MAIPFLCHTVDLVSILHLRIGEITDRTSLVYIEQEIVYGDKTDLCFLKVLLRLERVANPGLSMVSWR